MERMLSGALLMLIFLITPVYSYEVGANFAYRIGSDKVETIHINETDYDASANRMQIFTSLSNRYISSRRTSSIFGIFFAGTEFISAGFNSSYSSSEYLIQMAQGHNKNRFLLGFTNATQSKFDAAMPIVDANKLVLSTIGGFVYEFRPSFIYMRLEPEAEISNYFRWAGAVSLLVKNIGYSDGRYNISIEV